MKIEYTINDSVAILFALAPLPCVINELLSRKFNARSTIHSSSKYAKLPNQFKHSKRERNACVFIQACDILIFGHRNVFSSFLVYLRRGPIQPSGKPKIDNHFISIISQFISENFSSRIISSSTRRPCHTPYVNVMQ